MLYVMTLKWHDGLTREQRDGTLARRTQWEYPSGINVVGEYWVASRDLAVVVVFEADDYSPMMEIGMTWGDAFQIDVSPAVTAEEGTRIGPEVMSRRTV